jgi:hypothetical protein
MSEQQLDQPAPLLYFEGQPITREGAAEMRSVLASDREYAAAALNGDVEKQTRLAHLWMLERGMQPTPPLPATPSAADVRAVESQAEARVARENAARTESMLSAGFTPKAAFEVANGRPMLAEEQKFWQREVDAVMRSKELKQRYLDGDPEVVRKFRAASIGARGVRVGTLEEIQAWEAAHPFRAA